MRSVSGVGRAAALAAVIAAVVLVAVLLFGGGGSGYTVTADFLNAGQLVNGNPVQTGGAPIGSVEEHRHHRRRPGGDRVLRRGRPLAAARGHARQRSASTRSRASRTATSTSTFPPDGAVPGPARSTTAATSVWTTRRRRSTSTSSSTRSTRRRARRSRGSSRDRRASSSGMGKEANVGFQYLNPALSTSSRFFNELTRDTPVLERFLVDSSQLVTALAEKRDDLASLDLAAQHDDDARSASEKQALADSITELPPFMRRANTTFVNLRAALDDVDPLVEASKPVARQLGPFLEDARASRGRRRADGPRPADHDRPPRQGQRPDRPARLLPDAGRHRGRRTRAHGCAGRQRQSTSARPTGAGRVHRGVQDAARR